MISLSLSHGSTTKASDRITCSITAHMQRTHRREKGKFLKCNSRLVLALHLLFSGSLLRTPQYSWCTLLCTRYIRSKGRSGAVVQNVWVKCLFVRFSTPKIRRGITPGGAANIFLRTGGKVSMSGSWCHSKLNQKSSRLVCGL